MHLVRPDHLADSGDDMLYKGDTLYLDWLEDGIADWYLMPQVQLINSTLRPSPARRGHRRAGTAIRSKRAAAALNKAAFIVGADITEFLSLFLVLKNS